MKSNHPSRTVMVQALEDEWVRSLVAEGKCVLREMLTNGLKHWTYASVSEVKTEYDAIPKRG